MESMLVFHFSTIKKKDFTLNRLSGLEDFVMYTFEESFFPNIPFAKALALTSVRSESVN